MFYDLTFCVVIGGVIGARLLYIAQHREAVRQFWDIFKIWQGGIVFYGSAIGGVVGFFIYWLWRRFPLRPGLDVLAVAVAIGMGVGRLGCFFNGCCYGDLCDLPWAVRFPAHTLPWADHVQSGLISSAEPWSLPVHPTQLYAALDGFILFGLLNAYYPIRRRDGEVMALLMVTYPITRFLVERLRNDEGMFFAGMTISQNLSIVAFVLGLCFWWWLSRQPVGRYADSAEASLLVGAGDTKAR
jgi:phosphatidylglycerol:prolipoprotein diacylglycerol transferase